MALHHRFKELIQESDTNVSRLAKELGLVQSSLSRIVSGDSYPSYRTLNSLRETGVSLNWLIWGEGSMMRADTEKTIINYLEQQIKLLESQIKDKERLLKEKERLIKVIMNGNE